MMGIDDMQITNRFKQVLKKDSRQIGLWVALADSYSAEVCGGAGFDWLLLDGEHGPNDVRSILGQLQAVARYPVAPVVRPRTGDVALIKQLLDIGAQNLLIPMVEDADQAEEMVGAVCYPPKGIRGVGSGLARAACWNRVPRYLHEADDQICLLVQVENEKGIQNLETIAAVDGIDGVFIGPADLAAAMGHIGHPEHQEVQRVITKAAGQILAAGKAPGIFAMTESSVKAYLEMGFRFVAVGTDVGILARGTEALAGRYREKNN